MKILRLHFLVLTLVTTTAVNAQLFKSINPSLDFSSALGVSSYYGDLVQKSPVFREPSFSISEGIAYNLNPHLSFRSEFSYSKVQAKDSKNSRPDLIARNLSFKSSIWDFSLAAEYNAIDITGENKFTPYGFIGIGICHFNPYTTDRTGNKVYLQPMGTEGQGLAAYPDRKPYARTIIEIPFGMGFKYAVSQKVSLALEFKYRYLGTDYLDDVSNHGYPDKAVLIAKNPSLPNLTYRGDELPGGAPYPAPTLNRGNPSNKDSYYSGQLKILINLKNYSGVEINY